MPLVKKLLLSNDLSTAYNDVNIFYSYLDISNSDLSFSSYSNQLPQNKYVGTFLYLRNQTFYTSGNSKKITKFLYL